MEASPFVEIKNNLEKNRDNDRARQDAYFQKQELERKEFYDKVYGLMILENILVNITEILARQVINPTKSREAEIEFPLQPWQEVFQERYLEAISWMASIIRDESRLDVRASNGATTLSVSW